MATLQKFLSTLNIGIISVPDVYIILAPKNPHFFSWTIIYFWNYEKIWKPITSGLKRTKKLLTNPIARSYENLCQIK